MNRLSKLLWETSIKWLLQLFILQVCYIILFGTDTNGFDFVHDILAVFFGLKLFNMFEHFKIVWR